MLEEEGVPNGHLGLGVVIEGIAGHRMVNFDVCVWACSCAEEVGLSAASWLEARPPAKVEHLI